MMERKGFIVVFCMALFALFCLTGIADAASCKDRDSDGYFNNEGCGTLVDCDDGDATVNPGAAEVCDNQDNNCDGITDEGFDADGDGYNSCSGDCNDNDPAINPDAAEDCDGIVDHDCDGFADSDDTDCDDTNCSRYTNRDECGTDPNCDWMGGKNNGECMGTSCTDDDGDGYGIGGGCLGPDCDDTDPAVNPDAAEGPAGDPTCSDTIDNDCDGLTDTAQDPGCAPVDCSSFTKRKNCVANEECMWQDGMCVDLVVCTDNDGDGYNIEGGSCGPVDCNDTNAAVNPGATETCNGIDDNCDGNIDEGLTFDNDGDGYTAVGSCSGTADDCDDNNAAVNPGATEVCNSIDDNCDGNIDEGLTFDNDGDGYTAVGSCSGSADDCDDNNGAVNPGATETCNGIDDNCDTVIDDVDADSDGYSACVDDCDDANAAVNPGATETCNGIDDNCDGNIDEGLTTDADADGYTAVGSCSGTADDCDDNNAAVNPGAAETCNGIDDNCDGNIDEGLTTDADADGYTAVGSCSGTADDCDDNNAAINPGAADAVCDGVDDNCDGTPDDEYVQQTTQCGVGVCDSTGLSTCVDGVEDPNCTPGSPTEDPEATCDDSLDNDCDGLTDGEDVDDCPPTSNECIVCHNGDPTPGTGYVTRDVVGGDFTQASRHIFGGTPTNWDCIVCHREGDENAAQAPGGVVANTAFHQNAMVDMRNVDSPGTGWVWDKNNTSDAMYTDMDAFCMHCHDSDSSRGAGLGGASGIAVATGDDGVNLSPTMDERMKPYNSSDGLDQGTGGGTKFLAGYERAAVLDAYGQYDPSNPSHHAVRGRAYSSHDADWGDNAWVDTTLKSGQSLRVVYETARLHCADCHTVDQAAHGGPNGFMLQESSIDATCYNCHSEQVYQESGALSGSRWPHDGPDSGNFFNTGNSAKIGEYRSNPGSICLNCHGGRIGEGGTFIGYDGYGGIHGLPSGVDTRSGEERYRFQGGSYMSHSPGSWTTTAGSNTCYFAAGSSQDWSNCTRHNDTETGSRTPTMNYDRPAPDNPDAP
jgi:hypothetical protein